MLLHFILVLLVELAVRIWINRAKQKAGVRTNLVWLTIAYSVTECYERVVQNVCFLHLINFSSHA